MKENNSETNDERRKWVADMWKTTQPHSAFKAQNSAISFLFWEEEGFTKFILSIAKLFPKILKSIILIWKIIKISQKYENILQ